MASLFQRYFQASSMPKRLLQYALSRLEILDTDALDLENLDIAWGKNSVFEFKDVALRLRKLETLLQLPPSLEILKARVLLLRITIPVDIYSSPIVVEVEGVDSHLHVKSESEIGISISHTNHDRKRKRAYSRTSGSTQVHTEAHRARSGSNFEEDLDPIIPTAADLAESFLQAEPVEERAELEAAILSETQELSSSILSEDGETPVGTGAGLGLPGFVASFLQGIVDRLQVKINGVTINLEVDIPNESSRSTLSHPTDPVTLQLKVENIDIEGVTHEIDEVPSPGNEQPRFLYKKGKRLVCLSKIRGALISEANLFSSLGRSSALSSPSAAHSDVFEERKTTRSYASTQGSTFRSSDGASSPDQGSLASSRRPSTVSLPKRVVGQRSLHASTIASDSGRFDDAPEDDESRTLSGSVTADLYSEGGDSMFQNSAYLDQVTESHYSEDGGSSGAGSPLSFAKPIELGSTSKSPLATPRASMHLPPTSDRDSMDGQRPDDMLQSTIVPSRQQPRFSQGRVSHSQPSLPGAISSPPERLQESAIPGATHQLEDAGGSGAEDDTTTPVGEEDLAESQLFSHEDAESMYLSAVSHGSSGNMPGGWAGGDGVLSQSSNPTATETNNEPLDNLEHALSHVPVSAPAEPHYSAPSSPSVSQSLHRSRRVSSSSPVKRQRAPAVPQSSSSVSEPSTTSSDEYTKMTKEIFSLDQVTIYVPGVNSEPSAVSSDMPLGSTMFSSTFDGSDMSRSRSINVPGAFSTHLPSGLPRRAPPSLSRTVDPGHIDDAETDSSIEVDVGQLIAQFDIPVSRLVFKLVQRIKEALKQDSVPSESTESDQAPGDISLKLTAQHISLKFLERLEGISGPAHVAYEGGQRVPLPESDVLLRADLNDLQIDTRTSRSTTETMIKLKKFIFGYALENILSFDANLQIRASGRDLRTSEGDVVLKIIKTAETTRYDISTLPMHVSIDLQKLDDTFSWLGGLSSVLNMGSSIASNATITGNSPSKAKPRGVRFETPIKPDDKSLAAQNKADVRIGGFILDLVGTECSVGVETSSVKVVSRDEGIGVAIHMVTLSGPHLKRSNKDPAIIADIIGTRIEYLPTPKDVDLDRLLSLITPSKAKYDQDDDILLDTLLRQRKQGAVLRLTVEDFQTRVSKLDELSYLPELGEEISRLSTVAKYLPDDERPGLLSLITVRKFDGYVNVNRNVGSLRLAMKDLEVAQITLPALVAISIGTITAHRNVSEELLGPATDPEQREPRARSPAIMARMIGDEMEPVVKIKLWNLKVEYRVPTLMVLLGLAESATPQDITASLTASVATLTDLARPSTRNGGSKAAVIRAGSSGSSHSKPMIIDVVLRDCILSLNPLSLPSRILVVLTETHLAAVLPKDQKASANAEMGKCSILVIDNVANIVSGDLTAKPRRQSFDGGSTQVADLCATGFVSVSYISSAKAVVNLYIGDDGENAIDVELRDDLFVLESCADSTQTLISALNALTPPTPPSKEIKYRTKVIPVQDLLASLSGDAFGTAEGDYNFDDDFGTSETENIPEDDEADEFNLDSHYYQNPDEQYHETIFDDESGLAASTQLSTRDTQDGVLLDSFIERPKAAEDNDPLEFQDDHFGTGSIVDGTAHRWNSAKNTYDTSNAYKVKKSPLKVGVRDVHIIWNLFDGYDWQQTRDTITKAVQDVESRAIEKRTRNERRPAFEQDIEDEETVIGDFLFNSIYIGIPANRDPRELAAAINQELNDNATETESVATTSLSSSPSRQGGLRRPKAKRLRLNRSKHHKITFELRGVSVDLVVFPPGSGETQSSVDIRVHDFEIFDHVPTSTWRKFATYMQDAGVRETGTSMIHIEILNVKPVPELAASEIVLKATVLPLRLHVDQDALDFITRFFEFKDDSAPTPSAPGDVPFLQRVEVNSVQVKLDFKPKRVDYAGLRSGHTTEFMNFLILDEADMVLRHTIIYGISGFDKLGKCLNDIWMPDIKRNQLPGILAGLAPVRSIVNVGGGLRQLVVVPYREYQKDQRIARSLSKGAAAFAKTTGTELVKLGAKVAIGVQTVLQGAEGFLGSGVDVTMGEGEEEDEESKQISLYANQPVGVLQGLRGGYDGLQRDLILARDAIIAVPGEVMESGTAAGLVRAVRKHAPTVILRPAIGVAKAGGQILMGATNSLDPVNLQRADAKYKRH